MKDTFTSLTAEPDKQAQDHPKGLCRAIVIGITEQAKVDAAKMVSLDCVDCINALDPGDLILSFEHEPEDCMRYWDDVSGEQLGTVLTKAARKEEIEL